jgi:hypothetical protein
MKPRRAIPDQIARLMTDADRAAMFAETAAQATARGDARRERDLQRQCEAFLMYRAIWYLHLSHRAREQAGWPDLVFCVAGRPVAVELKSATGRLSDEQRECLAGLQANGQHVYVCRTFDEFIAAFNGTAKEWVP